MHSMGLPLPHQMQQSYALLSYAIQQPPQARDSDATLLAPRTVVADQPREIDSASQVVRMKTVDIRPTPSLNRLTEHNPSVSNFSLYSPTQNLGTSVVPYFFAAPQQQAVNVNLMEIGGSFYLVAMPPASTSSPLNTNTSNSTMLRVSSQYTSNSDSSDGVTDSTASAGSSIGSGSMSTVSSPCTSSNVLSLPQTITQLPALLNGCHISFMPIQANSNSSQSGLSASIFPSSRSNMDHAVASQTRCYSSPVAFTYSGETSVWERAHNVPGEFMRRTSSNDTCSSSLISTQQTLFAKQKALIDSRPYTNTTLLWTPEKHQAFVEIYDCLVNSNERVTQGAIFKEMKRRYPNFQFTLRQIQSKLQKYRLRLNAQASNM